MPMLARVVSFVAAAGTLDSSLAVRPAKDLDLAAGSEDLDLAAGSEDLDLAAGSENNDERNDLDIPVPSSFFPPGRDSIFTLKAGALASEAQQFGFPLGGTTSSASVKVHLAEDTAEECDYGITFTETECKTIGSEVLTELKISAARSGMISSQADDAPPGCSLMTGTDWAVIYNTNKNGKNSAKKYSLLCHGDRKAAHPVKEGKSECDFGQAITKVTDCLESVNLVHNQLLGIDLLDASGNPNSAYIVETKINVGKWPSLPPGCSIHLGKTAIKLHKVASDADTQVHDDEEVAWFNNDPEGKNDGTYLEVCTGTPVP